MSEPFDPYRKWLGIPPKDQPPNHYRLLAVELFEDDPDIISNAADRLMAHVRTFQSGPHSPESQKLLNELAAARHGLLDPVKKAQYDQQLRDRLLGAKPPSPPGPAMTTTPQPAAPLAMPAPVAVAAPMLAPQPYPQPMRPPTPVAPQPAAPCAPAISTKSFVRRKFAWQMPAAVVMVSAALVVSAYYLLQLDKQRPVSQADPPQANAANTRAPLETKSPDPPRATTAKARAKQLLDRGPKPSEAISPGRQTSPNDPGARADQNARSDAAEIAEPIRPSPGQSTAPGMTDAKRDSAPPNDHLTLGGLLNGPEIKPAVPDQKDLAKAERQARELFGDALANAKQAEQKQALAFRLIDKASENQTDAAAHYVLLRMARDAGAEGGSAKIVAAAVDEMAKWYLLDARELKLEALAKVGRTGATPQLKQELASATLALIDECVSADEYEQAAKSAGLALSTARALKDPRLMKEVADKKRDADRIAKAYAAVREDFARLEADEADPEANLAAGKFYCLVKQQWDAGLPHLARGSDPALKTLAERDLAKPGGADDEKAVGDAWWAFAETEKGPARTAALNRAAFWYRRSLQFLTGLEKDTVEKRLGELDSDAPAAAAVTYLADLQEANVNVAGNSFNKGRTDSRDELKVDGKLSPKGLFAPPASNGFSSVTYLVNKRARAFAADVGLAEWPSPCRSPLTFELWGDGGLLWRSKPIIGKQDKDHCEVQIGKIQALELRVLCPGSNIGAKAVWVEPRLTPK